VDVFPAIRNPHTNPVLGLCFASPAEEIRKAVSVLTRHELKEQIQHDAFSDSVSKIVHYSTAHRDQLIRWGAVAVAIVAIVIGAIVYSNHSRSVRQQELAAAFDVLSAPVGPTQSQFGLSYPTEDAKKQASIKALASVAARYSGSNEGLIAQYYLGTLKTQTDPKAAEANLKTVADSSGEISSLAKIALAQLYAGENRLPEAQQLLQSVENKPTSLVSKEQAQILRAQLDATTNPQQAKKILQSLQTPKQDPAISRAASELAAQVTR
jgi:Tetratricopeptide repeat-like domain